MCCARSRCRHNMHAHNIYITYATYVDNRCVCVCAIWVCVLSTQSAMYVHICVDLRAHGYLCIGHGLQESHWHRHNNTISLPYHDGYMMNAHMHDYCVCQTTHINLTNTLTLTHHARTWRCVGRADNENIHHAWDTGCVCVFVRDRKPVYICWTWRWFSFWRWLSFGFYIHAYGHLLCLLGGPRATYNSVR